MYLQVICAETFTLHLNDSIILKSWPVCINAEDGLITINHLKPFYFDILFSVHV